MEQTGEYRIAAGRDDVWAALNDPEVLARCLDGCEFMEKVADDRFDARIKAKVGPVRSTFAAELQLDDIQPPEHYVINANVKGGAAGFARGRASVDLTDEGTETLLQYSISASIGGKLAQVGSRLIDGAARKMADDFFARFRDELGSPAPDPDVGAASRPRSPTAATSHPESGSEEPSHGEIASPSGEEPPSAAAYETGGRWFIWGAAFLALLLALLFAFG